MWHFGASDGLKVNEWQIDANRCFFFLRISGCILLTGCNENQNAR